MQTVTDPTIPNKTPRAYFAHLYSAPGAITQVNRILYFVADEDDRIVELEPDMLNFCTVLGAMELAEAQHIQDLMAGGAPMIACRRLQGVA